MQISRITEIKKTENIVFIYSKEYNFSSNKYFSQEEINFLIEEIKQKKDFIHINKLLNHFFIIIVDTNKELFKQREKIRQQSKTVLSLIDGFNNSSINIIEENDIIKLSKTLIEGLLLSKYKFNKYLTKKDKITGLDKISFINQNITDNEISELQNLIQGINIAKDLVNEPYSYLNSTKLNEEINKIAKDTGLFVESLDKTQILSLKMGGLVAVNKGSNFPPYFSILEWNPEKCVNAKPIVFVGKGIVYDTGGLSLKPTPDSMDTMKSDMAGAASVIGLLYAVAKNKLPIHIIGLVPITDNACTNTSYAPGDVITMYDGTTVEVLNTDAEGRLILADALSYAKKYTPEIVIDLATLTGAAHRAIGEQGIVAMGNANTDIFSKLKNCGNETYERIVEFPLWDEYGEMIKSNIADLKNIGGSEAGAITAGKFLEHFVDYPWIHLDIAPTAFLQNNKDYKGQGATGVGIRLLYQYLLTYTL